MIDLWLFQFQRKRKTDARAVTVFRVNPDLPVVGFYYRFSEIKPQAGAFFAAEGFSRAVEPVKDVWQVLRSNSLTFIANAHDDQVISDFPADADFSAVGVLDCVGNQIAEDLLYPDLIGKHVGKFFRKIRYYLVFIGLCLQTLTNPFSRVAQIKLCFL